MRHKIPNADIYTYADISVACGEPKFEDAEPDSPGCSLPLREIYDKVSLT